MRIEGSIEKYMHFCFVFLGKGESTVKSDSVKWGNSTLAIQE